MQGKKNSQSFSTFFNFSGLLNPSPHKCVLQQCVKQSPLCQEFQWAWYVQMNTLNYVSKLDIVNLHAHVLFLLFTLHITVT